VVHRGVHRVLETLFAHWASAAHLLGKLVFAGADGKPQVRVNLGASAEGPPVLILQQHLSKLCNQSLFFPPSNGVDSRPTQDRLKTDNKPKNPVDRVEKNVLESDSPLRPFCVDNAGLDT
jgi:hypothetical protein